MLLVAALSTLLAAGAPASEPGVAAVPAEGAGSTVTPAGLGPADAPADTTLATISPLVPPGHWMFVPIWLRGATVSEDVEAVLPVVRFTLEDTGEIIERRLEAIYVRSEPGVPYARPAFRLVKGPDREGRYAVTVRFRAGARSLGSTSLGTLDVVPLSHYAGLLGAILLALSAAIVVLVAGRARPRRFAALAIVVLVAVFGRWLLGGHTVFLGLVAAIAIIARRAPTSLSFLARASLALILFDELYWGAMVNGARWTGLVLSGSALAGLGLLWGRWVRSPAIRGYGAIVFAMFLTGLYVATSIYKSFFLDLPAIAVAGDAGQVGRLLDSVLLAFKITHILALLAPLGIWVTWGWLRWRERVRPA